MKRRPTALMPRQRASLRLGARPLFVMLFDPANLIVMAFTVGFVLLLQAFLMVAVLLGADLLAAACWLASPRRRAAVIDRIRRKHRVAQAAKLRCNDRVQWMELEDTVKATRKSLPSSRGEELERLLDLYIDVGMHAARCEAEIERFGRVAAKPANDDVAALVAARNRRRTRATEALDRLGVQLTTVSTLIQLGCEDAVATRAVTAAGDLAAYVEEARRAAQLAVEASDEVYSTWDQLASVKA